MSEDTKRVSIDLKFPLIDGFASGWAFALAVLLALYLFGSCSMKEAGKGWEQGVQEARRG